MTKINISLVIILFIGMACWVSGDGALSSKWKVEQSLDIAEVPSGFPVGFCLLTAGIHQYVAYYDKDHRMTVASRTLDSDEWQYQVLPSNVGWDSHNYITMAVDGDGHLHVSGNMHCVKLIYFRTKTHGDIATLEMLPMTGVQESKVTYPSFIIDADQRMIFHYRDGGSGNGNEIYNVYDIKTKKWERLFEKPLMDGQYKMNAYMLGPLPGPNGWLHLVWVWRDTPDCNTNHHLSHARTKDLLHWESVFGDKVEMPMKLDEIKLWVDPIPSGGGIINGCQKLFFDKDNRPIITYHKSDTNGNMQIYAARPEENEWTHYLLTDWSKPIKFSGGGSMGFIGIRISELSRIEPGILTMTYRHCNYGSGRLVIEEQTLRPLDRKVNIPPEYPKELNSLQSDFAGMEIRRAKDIGDSGSKSTQYILQWETLEANRDRQRKPPLPKSSMLRLYKLQVNAE